ncbi:MAG TPA: hypothetical protein PKA64_03635, partial [Myxococcota bacterium]|nr:hypothetical protein [Myxococcota bacterium]
MITIWMIVASPAYALDPWALPLGVHTDMEACLDGDATACQDAAARFPDPAWAAWLGGDSGAALSDDARRVFRALRCADDDATACRQLGLDLLGAEDGATRVRGEMLLVRACGMGETVACSAAGVYAKTPEAAWQEVTRSEGAGAPSSRDLAAASKACAKDKSPGPACVEVIRLVDRNAGSEVGMRAAAAAARLACDKEPGGAACALAA